MANLRPPAVSEFSGDESTKDSVASVLPKIDGYVIADKLGEGGMGAVWRAWHIRTGRWVALKFVKSSYINAQRLHARFQREIEIASKLEHPNIARLYDTGLDRGYLYYSMQLIEGKHLNTYFAESKLSVQERLAIFLRVCHAVDYAHRLGVIHRDLKPSNILITPDKQPYILDFGLARDEESSATSAAASHAGEILGTLQYMAPEQVLSDQLSITIRTDVHGLGLLLWEVLIGRPARDSAVPRPELLSTVANSEISRIRAADRSLAGDLEAIVAKATSFDVDRRYAAAGELGADIQRYLSGEPVIASPLTISYVLKKQLRKRRRQVATVSIGLLILLAFAIGAVVRIRSEQKRAEVAAGEARQSLYFNSIAWADSERSTGDLAKSRELLETCPTELRNWEWNLLHASLDESLAIIHRGYWAPAMAVSRDGQTLSFVDSKGMLWRSDLTTLTSAQPRGAVTPSETTSLQLSDDGDVVAWKQGNAIDVADRRSDRVLHVAFKDAAPIQRIALHPSGDRIAVVFRGGELEMSDLQGNLHPIVKLAEVPRLIFFNRAGTSLLLIGSTVEILDLESKKRFQISSSGDVRGANFSGDDRTVILEHESNGLTVIPLDGTPPVSMLYPRNGDLISCVTINWNASKVACGWKSGRITVWDWKGRTEDTLLCGHIQAVRSLIWTRNNRLVSSSTDGTIRVWDSSNPTWRKTVIDSRNNLIPLTVSGDATRLAWADDSATVRIFCPTKNSEIKIGGDGSRQILALSLDQAGHTVAVLDNLNFVQVWNDRGERIFETAINGVDFVALSPDGAYLATSSWGKNSEVTLWPVRNGGPKVVWAGGPPLAWGTDSKLLCFLEKRRDPDSASPVHLAVYDVAGQKIAATFDAVPRNSTCVAFAPDNTAIAVATDDGEVLQWRIGASTPDWIVKVPTAGSGRTIFDLSFSPDGSRILAAGFSLELLDARSGRSVLTLEQSQTPFVVARFSQPELSLVSASLNAVNLWIVSSGSKEQTPRLDLPHIPR